MSELLQSLNPAVQAYLTWLLEPLTNFSFGLLAAILLAFLMLLSLLLMGFKLHSTNKDLKAATKRIKQCKNEQDFTNQIEAISETLAALPKLKFAWSEYRETLLDPLHEESVDDLSFKVYRNTQRPQAFFSESAIIGDIKPWIKSGTFIGFGLLLTFAGLVAALNESGQAFSGNADEVKAALASLLAVAGAKFLASVGGLGCAVVQDMAAGHLYRNSAKRSLDDFNQALEEKLQFASVASIAIKQYGHAQRQTKCLEELSDQLATRLGEQFEQAINQLPHKFGQEMQGVMAPMSEMSQQMSSFTGNMASSSTDALERIVEQFVYKLEHAQNSSMEATNQQLQQLATHLESSVSALQLNNDNMKHAASAFEQSLSGGAANMTGEVQNALTAMSQTVGQLASNFADQQSRHSESIESTQEAMIGQFHAALERFEATATDVANTLSQAMGQQAEVAASQLTQGATQAAQILGASGQQLSQSLEANTLATANKVEQLSAKMGQQLSESIAHSSHEMTQAVSQWRQHTEQTCTALGSMNQQLSQHSSTLSNANTSLSELHHAFHQSASSVKQVLDPLTQSADQFRRVSQQIEQSTSALGKHTEQTTQTLLAANTQVKQAIQGLEQQWKQQAGQLDGADQDLEQAFIRITRGLEQSLSQLDRFTGQLGDNLTKAVADLSTLGESLSESVEDLNDTLKARRP